MTPSDDPSAARAFEFVWSTLVGVLGTAATATMFRRAAKSAAKHRPDFTELRELRIVRDGLDYRFELPPSWHSETREPLHTLGYLIREELCPILGELTGPVVIDLLRRQPSLTRCGLLPSEES